MGPTRILLSASLLLLVCAWPVLAGPTSHALERADDGAVLFVDLDRSRLLRLYEGQLSVVSDLGEVPAGDEMQNLILSISGDLLIGQKKLIWRIRSDGSLEATKPPKGMKNLFINRPGDLAPDGSVYVARDFKNIQRSLPGGDAHPVLATDVISRIHSISVTPYGRVFFANNSEIAKLQAEGEVEIIVEVERDRVLGLAALGENAVLVLRQTAEGGLRLERLDIFGNSQVIVDEDQIAQVSADAPIQIATSYD